jgi:hypothetical protein
MGENKMIKLLNILQELNQEDRFPYKEVEINWGREHELLDVTYSFKTSKYTYIVRFDSSEYEPSDPTFELAFGVKKDQSSQYDTKVMTGEGNAKKILKTIKAIIEEFVAVYGQHGAEYLEVFPTSEKRRKIYKLLFPQLPQNIASKIKINESLRGNSSK